MKNLLKINNQNDERVHHFNVRNIIIKISYLALSSALIFIFTYFIQIPYLGGLGYFNLSDGIAIFLTITFGPIIGIFSTIIGCGLGDLVGGYFTCIPFTIIAKSLECSLAFLIYKYLYKTKIKYLLIYLSFIPMVLSYFIYYLIVYNFDLTTSLISSGYDVIQGVIGVSISQVFIFIFKDLKISNRYVYEK